MKTAPFRTPAGGRVDRTAPLVFRFDGRTYHGLEGDTLASALMANGVRVVGRSFRFHRPRGLMAAGCEEPNAIVQIGEGAAGEANLRATHVKLTDGLVARAVNAWPSARWDMGAALGLLGFLPAGFYYKTFIWPRWGFFAPVIRRVAGLGKAPADADPDLYAKTFASCDVLVIGAGPAGLAAARAVAGAGARVILLDDKPALGGSLNEAHRLIDGRPAGQWVEEVNRELAQSDVTVLLNTTASGWYDHDLLTLVQHCAAAGARPRAPRQRLWKVRARRVILAAGAFERPLVFRNNDRPGVMLAAAARAYAVRFGVLAGRRAVIATTNDSAYEAALDLLDAGLAIVAIADARLEPDGALVEQARARGLRILAGHAPVDTTGNPALTGVSLARLDATSRPQGPIERLRCDLLAVSGGWNPAVHLFSQSGGQLRYDERRCCFTPEAGGERAAVVGAAAGEFTLEGALAQGGAAGLEALAALGMGGDGARRVEVRAPAAGAVRPLWEIRSRRGRAWVDFHNDVTAADVRSAALENYANVEHLKRYTTLGMAPDQGKTSNVNGIGVLSQALGAPMEAVGTTRFRPPFDPVTLGVFAGRRVGAAFRPLRRLPSHAAQMEAGALVEDYGGWLRPARYPLGEEAEEASVRRECLAVRTGVGLMDASPLGKILVAGPDAGRFLDRIYVGKLGALRPGRCRYGLMLGEAGGVMDDGVVLRLDALRFLVGTSSAGAEKVADWLEEWLQCEWPELEAVVQPVTGQRATVTIAGPASGRLLCALGPDMNVSDAALPPMTFADGSLAAVGGACRVARVSYTGERSYEISVGADRGEALWRAVWQAGRPLGAAPFGIEALMRLRLEKGYLHVGVDTEATTTPQDLGYGVGADERERDFVGRRSTLRAGAGPRRQLVGLETLDARQPIEQGSHIVSKSRSLPRRKSEGWVTSSGFSPSLGRWVALALVEDGAQRLGELVRLYDRGGETAARVRPVCAYDPEGVRLRA